MGFPLGSSCPPGLEPRVGGLYVHLSLQQLVGYWLSLLASPLEEHVVKNLWGSGKDHLKLVEVEPLQLEEVGQLEEKE